MSEPTREERAEWESIKAACNLGRPRRFIERYLWIKDVDGQIVPMKLLPLQEWLDQQLFGPLPSYYEPMTAVYVKPRDAGATTYCLAAAFAFRVCVYGFAASSIIDTEDKVKHILAPADDLFDKNLPEWLKPQKGHWDLGLREYIFRDTATGLTTMSSMAFASAGSVNALRGPRPKMIIEHERFYYDRGTGPAHDHAVNGAKTKGTWHISEGTPFTPDGGGYASYQSIKAGTDSGKALFRTHFHKPDAVLGPNDPGVRPVDREEIRQTGTLTLTPEEIILSSLFVDSPPKVMARILWKRSKVQQYVNAEDGDPLRGKNAFLRDDPKDDVSCWLMAGEAQFNPDVLLALERGCKGPIEDNTVAGFRTRLWCYMEPGHVYFLGLDFASNRVGARDRSAGEMLDCNTGEWMGEIFGKGDPRELVRQAVVLCRRFGGGSLTVDQLRQESRVSLGPSLPTGAVGPLLIPETNSLGMETADIAREDLEYGNVYRRPARKAENTETEHYRRRDWGWWQDEKSRMREISAVRAGVNGGRLWTRNKDLIAAWRAWDPTVDPHLPDRMSACGLTAAVLEEK